MSLDVHLKSSVPLKKECPHCGSFYEEFETVFDANITHNLGRMANEAGIYEALWRPEEIGITMAKNLIPIIEVGLADMIKRPEHYKQFNAKNGWGMYEHFIPWIEKYLTACKEYPESIVTVSR